MFSGLRPIVLPGQQFAQVQVRLITVRIRREAIHHGAASFVKFVFMQQNIGELRVCCRFGMRVCSHHAALAIDPNSLEAAWGVAESNRRFGNNQKARQSFQEILARDPQNLQALGSLLKLETDFSRWPEAEALQRRGGRCKRLSKW